MLCLAAAIDVLPSLVYKCLDMRMNIFEIYHYKPMVLCFIKTRSWNPPRRL